MSLVLYFLSMIFLHIVDDFHLQGILASMKQKSWWKKNAPDEMYKFDYLVVLFEHSFSWAFMINIPVFIYFRFNPPWIVYVLFTANLYMHAVVDDLKANRKTINLVIDQTIHFLQIGITFFVILINYYIK